MAPLEDVEMGLYLNARGQFFGQRQMSYSTDAQSMADGPNNSK